MFEMEWFTLLFLLCATFLFQHQFDFSEGCHIEEKKTLLDFKQYVTKFHDDDVDITNTMPYSLLPSWVEGDHDDPAKSDCCSWERVTCSPSSGHVTQLSLDRVIDVKDTVSLNLSLFLPLKHLRSLNLSFNYFSGWILTHDYRSLSTLKMLETLDLSSNILSESIIKPLSALKSLKNLILTDNSIHGYFPLKELFDFEELELLDLSTNELSSPTIEDYNSLLRLKKLRILNLANNMFDKEILKYLASSFPALESLFLHQNEMHGSLDRAFGNLTNLFNLEVLVLRSNELHGPLPQGLCEMKNLHELDLSFNQFFNSLPLCLSNLTSLRALDLSSNSLTGTVPLSVIASLTSLIYLSLSHNQFEGLFPLSILANHSRLELLSIEMDDNKFEVDTENPTWIPSFQLKVLDMPRCKLNMPKGSSMPSFLLYQHDLQYINLSGNDIVGKFPSWLFINNSNLEFVLMNDNSLSGAFQLPTNSTQSSIHNYWSQMKVLKISNNNIRGQLPENIGNFFLNLEYLNASTNALVGEIPSSFGNMSTLWMLDLSHNNLIGEVPTQLLSGCISLSYLKLSYNSISGKIFLGQKLNLSRLVVLLLDNNNFIGTLQEGLKDLNALYSLGVSYNKLSGILPSWIGNFSNLGAISMSGNNFSGEIPKDICKLDLAYINLSHNRFSGSIPQCFNMRKLAVLQLRNNTLVGSIPKDLLANFNLITLDLGSNKLSGTIPYQINGLGRLKALLLGGNNLQGELPNEICQLKELRLLDLSSNELSGKIPACFAKMSFGKGNVQFESVDNPKSSTYIHVVDSLFVFTNLVDIDAKYASIEEMEVRTKTTLLSYHGSILNYMSILDLSSNQFTGHIPWQIGDLTSLHSLNLSHNFLNGLIPESLHNMKELESLDLSCNNLTGIIPLELIELQFLAFFNVSYNNLSGKAPDKGQFATFEENSYKGNPLLSWSISNKGSGNNGSSTPLDLPNDEDESFIDITSFYSSFVVSYGIVLITLVLIIWVNPHWRMTWSYFIDKCIYKVCPRLLQYMY